MLTSLESWSMVGNVSDDNKNALIEIISPIHTTNKNVNILGPVSYTTTYSIGIPG